MDTLFQILFLILFAGNSTIALVFLTRQIAFSLKVLGKAQINDFSQAAITDWPTVTILVAAHNEERVIAGCLRQLIALDYPAGRCSIIVVNDRSSDGTRGIVDGIAADPANRVRAIHRPAAARPGKPAALQDAFAHIDTALVVFFDADYLPEPALLKKLVAPFIDPSVAATMGRVTPYNTNVNLLTRLLDLERRGGYTVDQAARSMWGLLPQFGGTVGGVRMSALAEIGGWSAETLAEDTDLTYRAFLAGYSVEYVDDALCHEESPQSWQVRFRQIRRWACGHNQCLFRYLIPTLLTRHQPLPRRLDAAVVLMFFLFPSVSLLSLVAAMIYPTVYAWPPLNFGVISALSFVVAFGNFSPFFQCIAAVVRDRQPAAAALLPLLFLSSAISMIAATQGLLFALRGLLTQRHLGWDKTIRYRRLGNADA